LILSTAKRGDVWYASVTDEKGRLVACNFSDSEKAAQKSAIQSLPEKLRHDIMPTSGDSEVIDALDQIYAGSTVDQFPSIVLLTSSPFVKSIYEATMRIPKGRVTTYGILARLAGSKRLCRAVGNAMARNPLPLVVPCHRVVASTLRVGHYGSALAKRDGTRIKQEILAREGVQFDGEKILRSCVWDPS
jgi:O-6-methylguanine DNA methyltransferase